MFDSLWCFDEVFWRFEERIWCIDIAAILNVFLHYNFIIVLWKIKFKILGAGFEHVDKII